MVLMLRLTEKQSYSPRLLYNVGVFKLSCDKVQFCNSLELETDSGLLTFF